MGSGLGWRARLTRRWQDVAGAGSMFLLTFLYLSPALKDGGSFGTYDLVLGVTTLGSGLYPVPPYNKYNSDDISQMAAWNALDWRQIHAGHFPLWNDLNLLGLPHFFNFQSAVLGLPNLVSYLFPLSLAYLVAVGMKLVIAGTGAYFFARVIGLRPPASAFAGAMFMLSGGFAGWLTFPLSEVLAWSGWLLGLAILCYRERERARYVVLLAVVVAFSVYGGFPEGNIILGLVFAVLVLVAVVASLAMRRRLSAGGGLRIACGAGAGLLLSAPLWLPGAQLLHIAHRSTSGGYRGLPLKSLTELVAPGFFGLPTSTPYDITGLNYYEVVSYVGLIALALAVVAVCRWWRRPIVVALACASGAALLATYQLDGAKPVQRLLGVVGLGSVEWLRTRILLGLPVGALAGIGLETLVRYRHERRNQYVFGVVIVVFALVVIGLWVHALSIGDGLTASRQEHSLIWPTVMVGICAAGLLALLVAGRVASAASPASPASPVEGRAQSSSRWSAWRVISSPALAIAVVLGSTSTAFLFFSGVGLNSYSDRFYPESPAIARLVSAVGTGLVATDAGESQVMATAPAVGIYPEANIPYGIAQFNGHDPLLPQVYFVTFRGPVKAIAGAAILLPLIDSAQVARQYGVQWILVGGGAAAPPGTEYRETIASERLYYVPGAARFSFVGGGGTVGSVSMPSPSQYKLHVSTPAAARLVLRVTYVPGWHATVDGQAVPVSRYDNVMMSIEVPAGTHVVQLTYFPGLFKVGLVVALGGVVFLVGVACVDLVRRRRAGPGAGPGDGVAAAVWEDWSLGPDFAGQA